MNDNSNREFAEICRLPAIKSIHAEAVALAPSLGGDYEKIQRVWRGPTGIRQRIADALEPLGRTDAKRCNEMYDLACKCIFSALRSTETLHEGPQSHGG